MSSGIRARIHLARWYVEVGSTTPIDDDRRSRIHAKGLDHGRPTNHNVDKDCTTGLARSQPINRNILERYSNYQHDSEDESKDR